MISILSLIVSLLAAPQLPDAASLTRLRAESALKHRTEQFVSESTVEIQTAGIPGIKVVAETTVSMMNPGKSRSETKTGTGTVMIVSDGDATWIYQSLLKQYTKTPAASGPMALLASMGMSDLPDFSATMQSAKTLREEIVQIDGKARPCWVVETRFDASMIPPVRNVQITDGVMTQCIDKELGISLRTTSNMKMQTAAGNTQVQMQMNQSAAVKTLKFDETLDASLFTFTPPPDAKEVTTFAMNVVPKADLSGKNAPAFDVKALEGTPYSLSSLKGKTVLLDFWASWCGPCRQAMPALENINREFKDKGLVLLGIDAGEDRKTVEGFLKTTPASYPTVLSIESDILSRYQVTAYPTFVLIGPDGRIAAHEIGYRGEPALRAMLAKANVGGSQAIQNLPAALPPNVFRVGAGVSPPTVLTRVTPEYTDYARAAKIQGTIVLEAVILEDGRPQIIRVVRSLGYGLDENAIATIQQWRFNPGMRDGIPVAVSLNIEVNFNLADRR